MARLMPNQILPVAMIFGGCMSAIFAMEIVLKGDPESGNLLTLSAIIMVLLQSLPGRFEGARLKPLAAPIWSHLQFSLLWVSMSVLANYAFAFHISVPIFTLVRSCNVVASVLLGRLFFSQSYSWGQLICASAVTMGVLLASAGEAKSLDCSQPSSSCKELASHGKEPEFLTWVLGVSILILVQLIQGALGHLQAGFYKRFDAPKSQLCDEYLFTSHVAALLPLLFLWADIAKAWRSAMNSEPLELVPIPSRLVWLLLNNVAQTICLKGVFLASATLSPLALTLVLSVRKFWSVLVSIVWFRNPWTVLHTAASVLIFGGAFAYSQAPDAVRKKAE